MGSLMGQQQGAFGAQGQAYGQMGQMGSQMGQLGSQQRQLGADQQQQQFERFKGMEQAGARTQQEQQRDDDIAYGDFQNQRDWDKQQATWQANAMQTLPYENTVVQGDYGTTPGLASDISEGMSTYQAHLAGQQDNTNETPDYVDDQGFGGAAGGGYLSSSGILAPYHKKLIDGLYAGGRINY
jgi:hypothetical protein